MTETNDALDILLRNAADSAHAFAQGASLARNPAFRTLFADRAAERRDLVERLCGEGGVSGVGAGAGTAVGAANTLITLARNTVAGESDKGLVRDIVRREQSVLRHFTSVADDAIASERTRQLASDALVKLNADQRELEDLDRQFSSKS